MPALSEVNTSSPPTGADLRLMVKATVLETPASPADTLRLTVPDFDPLKEYEVEAGRWSGDPQASDEVLLGFDAQGDEWLVSGPETPFPSIPSPAASFEFITPVTKVNRNTAVGFTTVSIASDTGSDTAQIAIFEAVVDGIATTGSYVESYFELRETGTSVITATPKFTSYAHGSLDHGGGVRMGHYLVPLDASEQFDYRVVFGHASSLLAQLILVGYIT